MHELTWRAKTGRVDLVLVFIVAAFSGTAFAQPANVSTPVIVSATKRDRSIDKIPVSVTRVEPETLHIGSLFDTPNLIQSVAGLSFAQGALPNSASFGIRGVTTYASSDAIGQSVSVVQDDVINARTVGIVAEMADLDRVEVLRGPQGTLFGANATAGLIQIVSAKPTYVESLQIGATVASHEERRLELTANAPLVDDKAAIRLALWQFKRPGFIAAPNQPGKLGDLDNQGARLSFRWDPSDAFSVGLVTAFSDQKSLGGAVTHRSYQGVSFSEALRARDIANGVTAGRSNFATSADGDFEDRLISKSATLRGSYEFSGIRVVSISGFRRYKAENAFDADYSDSVPPAPNIFLYTYQARIRQISQEFRVEQVDPGKFDYVFGVYADRVAIANDQNQAATGLAAVPLSRHVATNLKIGARAAFADLSLHLTERLTMLAGARWSDDTAKGDFRRIIPAGGFVIPGGPFAPLSLSESTDAERVSWRTGVQWQASAGAQIYATASRGYKAPGLNYTVDTTAIAGLSPPIVVAPERATSYEIGMKAHANEWAVRGALFYATYRNMQVNALLPTAPASFAITNASEMKAQGAEAELTWTHGFWFVKAGAAYTDAEFTDFRNAPCYPGQTIAQGCKAAAIGTAYDVTGTSPPDSPPWSANLEARFVRPISNSARAFAEVQYSYKDGVHYGLGSNPADRERARRITNAAVGIRLGANETEFRLFGRNLFNAVFANRLVPNNGAILQYVSYDARSSYGVALSHRF